MKYILYALGIIVGLPVLGWFILNILAMGLVNPFFGIFIIPWLIIVPGILIGLKIKNNKKVKDLETENEALRKKLSEHENQKESQ